MWEKGSFGVSGSLAGLTSDGKNLTEGLDYSSSALDLVSHNQPVSKDGGNTGSVEEIERDHQIRRNDMQFSNSPLGQSH